MWHSVNLLPPKAQPFAATSASFHCNCHNNNERSVLCLQACDLIVSLVPTFKTVDDFLTSYKMIREKGDSKQVRFHALHGMVKHLVENELKNAPFGMNTKETKQL